MKASHTSPVRGSEEGVHPATHFRQPLSSRCRGFYPVFPWQTPDTSDSHTQDRTQRTEISARNLWSLLSPY